MAEADPQTPNGWSDLVRTGPGTLGGRYMRLFWHPVCRAQDVEPGHAKPLRIMSEGLTLYRGEDGTPHVVAFRCAHRGTQLSTGWVEGDNLRCFYHGWLYGPDGQCLEQPAEPESFAQKVRIRSYPTEEYLGLIFAYLGEGEPPPFPQYPDFEREDAVHLVETYHARPCNFFNVLEKNVDPVHADFVHGNKGVGIPRVSVEESDWGIAVRAQRPSGEVRVNQIGMPNLMHNLKPRRNDEETGWRDDMSWRVPIDDTHHSSFNVKLVHRSAAEGLTMDNAAFYEKRAREAALGEAILAGTLTHAELKEERGIAITAAQDHVFQVGQGAIPDRTQDRLGGADGGVILLRRIWERELKALAEGRPLKQWRRDEAGIASSTEQPRIGRGTGAGVIASL